MPDRAAATESTSQYLTFSLAGDSYAIAIARVREIVEFLAPTRVPGTPKFILGVVNLRGRILPVLDLAVKLGLEPSAVSRRSCIVIVEVSIEHEQIALGLLVDSVADVLDLAASDLAPAPPFGTPVRLDYLSGLGKTAGALLLVLDIDRVLSPEELEIASSLTTPREENAALDGVDGGKAAPP